MNNTDMNESILHPFKRPAEFHKEHFQVVIVGGGINGVGTFRDLCLQGIKCLMIDKGDIGSGASSTPTRMIHGGFRYLENAEFSLVRESAQERNNLLKTAPHLIKPLHTVIPLSSRLGGIFGSVLRFLGANPPAKSRGVLAVALGLRIYDFMGRHERSLPRHTVRKISESDSKFLRKDARWTAHFYDAWITHPERLMHELINDGFHEQRSSVVSNYCELVELNKNELKFSESSIGKMYSVTADVVINATGAWLEQTSSLFDVPKGRLVGTKGSHLVLDQPVLFKELNDRMVYFEANDGRVCVVYPFMGRVLAGSTDIPVGDPDLVQTEESEIDYLLNVLGEVFPNLSFHREQILYTYVGVRPLATVRSKKSPDGAPGKISRDHHVLTDKPTGQRSISVVNLVGGKWTTFRALAEEATDSVLSLLNKPRKSSTLGRLIPSPDLGFDGGDIQSIRRLCRTTGVVHLSDLVLHRTLDAILGRIDEKGLEFLALAASQELGWDEKRLEFEMISCRHILSKKHNVKKLS